MITAFIAGAIGGAVTLAASNAASKGNGDKVTETLKELHRTKCKNLQNPEKRREIQEGIFEVIEALYDADLID